jgi:hypothetical protein
VSFFGIVVIPYLITYLGRKSVAHCRDVSVQKGTLFQTQNGTALIVGLDLGSSLANFTSWVGGIER